MQYLNAAQVASFLKQRGLSAPRPPVGARRVRRLGGLHLSAVIQTGQGNAWGDGDGWGNGAYGQGNRDSSINMGHDYYDNIVLNPQFITGSGASVAASTAPNLADTTDTSSSSSATSSTNNNTQITNNGSPLPGSNAAQINYLTVNPLSFTGQFYLNANYRRGMLLIQNQGTGILYVNFGTVASASSGLQLAVGVGLLFDTKTPNNSVYGLGTGYVLEGTNLASTPLG